MQVDDELCLCFHVSCRKVLNYIRIHRVKVPSQLSECQSAGTGCGWCRAAMRRLVDCMEKFPPDDDVVDDWQSWLDTAMPNTRSDDYSAGRKQHIDQGHGTPPTAS